MYILSGASRSKSNQPRAVPTLAPRRAQGVAHHSRRHHCAAKLLPRNLAREAACTKPIPDYYPALDAGGVHPT